MLKVEHPETMTGNVDSVPAVPWHWRSVPGDAEAILIPTMPQELARRCGRALAVGKSRLAIDQYPAIASGLLHPTPLSAWQVMDNLHGGNRQVFIVVDRYIRRRPFAQHATPVKAASHQTAESSNRFQSSKVNVNPASVVTAWP